jgi:glycolate oxidase subunit GlcD
MNFDTLEKELSGKVLLDEHILKAYSKDMSIVEGRALALVRPQDEQDVLKVVRWANESKIPVVARGGGSSLEGESVPFDAIVIDFSSMNKVLELDEQNLLALVEPGVVNREFNKFLSQKWLFYPPNPGSWEISTLGGNAATNAAGPRSYKYGSTRNWVAALEAVTGKGELSWFGTRAKKSSSGLDLVRLLVGSEGTLAIFTKLLVRLAPIPEKRVGVIVPLKNVTLATNAVVALSKRPDLGISAIEFVDEKCVNALNSVYHSSIPECGAALMLEIESTQSELETKLDSLLHTLLRFEPVGEPLYEDDVDSMWDLRGRITFALEKIYGKQYREDVAVPVTNFPKLVEGVKELFSKEGMECVLFGHAGDGNLHLEFKHLESTKLHQILTQLFSLSVKLGGTISGEHGIGALKARYLNFEHSALALQIMKQIKSVFDPNRILNPKKSFDAL